MITLQASVDLSSVSQALSESVVFVEQLLAPIDPVLFCFVLFLAGLFLGLALGKKQGIKDFFKMPSAHWKARRK